MRSVKCLLVCLVLGAASCTDSEQQRKDLAFYVTLQRMYKTDLSPQMAHLNELMKKYMDVEKAHGWHYTDTAVSDTFIETINKLNHTILAQAAEIDTVQEVDPSINLKAKSQAFYRDCDTATRKMAVFFGKLFRDGIDSINDNELNEGNENRLLDEVNRLNEVKRQFREAHHITNEMLQPYGL